MKQFNKFKDAKVFLTSYEIVSLNKRKRIYDPMYLEKVIQLHKEHPGLGKKRLQPFIFRELCKKNTFLL